MPQDRDADCDHAFHRRQDFKRAFNFHARRAGFLDQPPGVEHGVLDIHLVGQKRHVRHDRQRACAAHDQAGVVDHLVHRHGQGRGVARNDVGERVADEQKVNGTLGQDGGHEVVVGRQRDDLLARRLFGVNGRQRGDCGTQWFHAIHVVVKTA